MKKLILLLSLLAAPALAQQTTVSAPVSPDQAAWELMYDREYMAHHADIATAMGLKTQVETLTKQLADANAGKDALTKQLADANAAKVDKP